MLDFHCRNVIGMVLSMVFLFLFYRSLFFSVEAIFGQSTPPNKRGVEFDQDIITNSINELDMMYPSESNKNFALYSNIRVKTLKGIGVFK